MAHCQAAGPPVSSTSLTGRVLTGRAHRAVQLDDRMPARS
jgi:hypothetical protein